VDLVGIEPTTSSMPSQIIDGAVLTSRQNRQERPSGRYLLPKCCQNSTMRATGLIVWNQPSKYEFSDRPTFVTIRSERKGCVLEKCDRVEGASFRIRRQSMAERGGIDSHSIESSGAACYRRESRNLNRSINSALRTGMHRTESQQPQQTPNCSATVRQHFGATDHFEQTGVPAPASADAAEMETFPIGWLACPGNHPVFFGYQRGCPLNGTSMYSPTIAYKRQQQETLMFCVPAQPGETLTGSPGGRNTEFEQVLESTSTAPCQRGR